MNDVPMIEAQVVRATSSELPYPVETPKARLVWWQRLLIALGILVVFGGIGAGVWMVGILMFTFSLDGANSQDLPEWLDVFMLIGWPVSIALVAIVPAFCVAIGLNWKWCLGGFLATVVISIGVYFSGLISVFSSL